VLPALNKEELQQGVISAMVHTHTSNLSI
jgi:hypothetical protein